MANEVARQIIRGAQSLDVAKLRGKALAEHYGPLMRADYESRMNSRIQNDRPAPAAKAYTQQAPSEPLGAPSVGVNDILPPLPVDRAVGPQRAQQQPHYYGFRS